MSTSKAGVLRIVVRQFALSSIGAAERLDEPLLKFF
jgi:hypothetical protein